MGARCEGNCGSMSFALALVRALALALVLSSCVIKDSSSQAVYYEIYYLPLVFVFYLKLSVQKTRQVGLV